MMTDWNSAQWLLAAVIVVVSLVISVWAGGRITTFVLGRASQSPDAAESLTDTDDDSDSPHPGAAVEQVRASTDDADVEAETPLRGGRWIGRIERAAATLAFLAAYPAAIAIIVAIKGLGRYPEIRKSPSASEKFVIGTLTSLTLSSLIGALGHWALLAL